MHLGRKNYFSALEEAASEASASPEWADYASYCQERGRGLRRQAFVTLERFISSLEIAPFAQRRRFVCWLLTRPYGSHDIHLLAPHPLQLRLVEPTLLEWTVVEPECSEPHRWLGGDEHLRCAIKLRPDDQLARRMLVGGLVARISMSAHEIPSGYGYHGNAGEGLATLSEAEALLQGLKSDKDRNRFAAHIEGLRSLILEYLAGL